MVNGEHFNALAISLSENSRQMSSTILAWRSVNPNKVLWFFFMALVTVLAARPVPALCRGSRQWPRRRQPPPESLQVSLRPPERYHRVSVHLADRGRRRPEATE